MAPHYEKLDNFTIDAIFERRIRFFDLGLFAMWRHGQICCQSSSFFYQKAYKINPKSMQWTNHSIFRWKRSIRNTNNAIFLRKNASLNLRFLTIMVGYVENVDFLPGKTLWCIDKINTLSFEIYSIFNGLFRGPFSHKSAVTSVKLLTGQ